LYKDRVSTLAGPDDRFAEARIVAKHSDVVVLCLGLDASIEGEEGDAFAGPDAGGDRSFIELPGRQNALLETVLAAADGKPVIVVSISGGAMALGLADEKAAAVIQAFYPGAEGGHALARLLFGLVSPSGKLPVTFYRATAGLPPFTSYDMAGRTYRYFSGHALYPFGFGLSYAAFELSGLTANTKQCSVEVANTGTQAARETVQVYTRLAGQKERWSLCGTGEVFLKAKERATLTIILGKSAFARYDADGNLKPVPGTHTLYAGFTQPDEQSVERRKSAPLQTAVTVGEAT
jgi:beta-glucosidase